MSEWVKHWEDMPEFHQEDKTPYKILKVKIATKEDLDTFSSLVAQEIRGKTKSIWFPKLDYEKPRNFIYDEE